MRAGDGALKALPQPGGPERGRIEQIVSNWPTPCVAEPVQGESHKRHTMTRAERGGGMPPNLATLASTWPTPTATDTKGPNPLDRRPASDDDLATAVTRWPTPAARDYKGANSAEHMEVSTGALHLDQLPNFVEHVWSTPRATDGEKGGPNQQFGAGGKPLPSQAVQWVTPRVHEVGQYQYSKGDKTKPTPTLTGQVFSSLPAQVTEQDGESSSTERRSLNPVFVEFLMGWPPGWTLLVSIDFGCSATALFRWQQRMRSALLQLPLHQAPAPQLSLFG